MIMGKKKNRDYDFDLDDQQAMLDNIDAFISGEATVASFAEEHEEKDNEEWMDTIGSILGLSHTNKQKDESMDKDTFLNTILDTSGFKPEDPVSKNDEPEDNDDDKQNERMFSVTWDKENSLVSFSDEIRIFDIDLNALTADDDSRYSEKFVSLEDMKENIKEDFAETIYNVITNFLPKAIFSREKLLDVFRHIKSFDDTRFMFFKYPGEDNIILAYEMMDVSWEDIDEIIREALERNCAISLLIAIESISNQDGISFRNYSQKAVKKLMLNKDYKENQDYFIENLYESSETEVDKSMINESLDDIIDIGSFLGDEPVYTSLDKKLDAFLRNASKKYKIYGEMGNPEDKIDEETEIVSEKNTVEVNETDEVDEIEPPEIEMEEDTEEVSEIEIPDDEEEEMDHDEAEELYFGSKKPRTTMKPSKKLSDDEFVVTRRN